MSSKKNSTAKLLDGLFAGASEADALKEAGIKSGKFEKILQTPDWKKEYNKRCEALKREAEILLVRYLPVAAMKLIALVDSEKEVTARQACLDIISICKAVSVKGDSEGPPEVKVPDAFLDRLSESSAGG